MLRLFIIMLLALSCEKNFHTTNNYIVCQTLECYNEVVDTIKEDNYIPIARATLNINKESNDSITSILKKLFGIENAFANSSTVNITYTSSPSGLITLNSSGINIVESGDSNTLDFGTIVVSDLKLNKLKVCGLVKINNVHRL